MSTLFGIHKWEPALESGSIAIDVLSKDAQSLILLVDTMGTAMKPVKNDMVGNIRKINDAHQKLCPNAEYLHELLELEVSTGSQKKDPSGCVGTLWLTRGMHYFFRFLEIMLEEIDNTSDSMQNAVCKAYDETLRVHHNFVMRGAFTVVSHAAPRKSALKTRLMEGNVTEEVLVKELTEYVELMRPTLAILDGLVAKYELK